MFGKQLLLPALTLSTLTERHAYARAWNRRANRAEAVNAAGAEHVVSGGAVVVTEPPLGVGYDYVWCSDVMRFLCNLPNDYADCVVTSPPYFGLRDYGTGTWEGGDSECDHSRFLGGNGDASKKQVTSGGTQKYQYRDNCPTCGAVRIDQQIGLEPTPAEFVATMVTVFREVRRVLKPSGTCWINLGDSYSTHKAGKVDDPFATSGLAGSKTAQVARDTKVNQEQYRNSELPEKNLLMIPARVAIALQDDGWYLRSEIVWHKPNVMPESVTDRPTKAHEMVYLLTKCPDYFYDQEAIREPHKVESLGRYEYGLNTRAPADGFVNAGANNPRAIGHAKQLKDNVNMAGRNKRDVWTVNSEPTPFAHFATFPRKLIEPMILAGCPDKACGKCGKPWKRCIEASGGTIGKSWHDHKADIERGMTQGKHSGGVGNARDANGKPYTRQTVGFEPTCNCNADTRPGLVLDPFFGSGTTGLVARANGRHFIGCDLNPEYVKLARERLRLPFEAHYMTHDSEVADLPLFAFAAP